MASNIASTEFKKQQILKAVREDNFELLKTYHDSTIFALKSRIRSEKMSKEMEQYIENIIDLRQSTL